MDEHDEEGAGPHQPSDFFLRTCLPSCAPAGCDVAASHTFDVDVNAPVTNEVCILIAMLIALRLCVYYALQWKTTFRKRA